MKNPGFTFKHDEDSLNDALGLPENTLESIGTKIIGLVQTFEAEDDAEGKKEGTVSCSKIIEKMIDTFTDVEILVLASIQIKESIINAEKKASEKQISQELLDMLKIMKSSDKLLGDTDDN